MQFEEFDDEYTVYANESNIVYVSSVKKESPANSDQIDFETNYKTGCNKSLNPLAKDAVPYVRITEKQVGKTLKFQGYEVDCVASDITIHEVKFNTDIEIVGAACMVEGAHDTDKIQLKIIDKDNLLGYGIGTVLLWIGRDIPAKMVNKQTILIDNGSALTLNAGFYLQFSYQNIGVENARLFFAYKYFS